MRWIAKYPVRYHEIILEGFEPPRVLYHGTKRENIPSIKEHGGLKAEFDQSWRQFGKGIYLSNCPATAGGYGPIVFAIDVSKLDQRKLVPDDMELYDYFDGVFGDGTEGDYDEDEFRPSGIHEADWVDSLRIVSQCQYLGDIPIEAMSVAPKLDGADYS